MSAKSTRQKPVTDAIRAARLALGLRLQDVSDRLAEVNAPMSTGTLSKIENGRCWLKVEDLIPIAFVLGTEIDQLFPPDESGPCVWVHAVQQQRARADAAERTVREWEKWAKAVDASCESITARWRPAITSQLEDL